MSRFLLPLHFVICENDKRILLYRLFRQALLKSLAVALLFVLIDVPAYADATQISGGVDGRALSDDPLWGVGEAGEEGVRLHGAFLNLRHVISDKSGDRYILVGQVDAKDNFEEFEAYQFYGQVKGPLGRINLRAGRYILPFGLLANLDTERQLIQSLESLSLGIKLDTGVQVFGFTGPFDYAVSVSQGTGKLDDQDGNKLLVARVGRQAEYSRWGLSYMDGQVVTDGDDFLQQGSFDRQRLALDVEVDWVPWLLRGELITGQDDGRSVYGGVLLGEYAFNARVSLDTKLARWDGADDARALALGVTYRLPRNVNLRAAVSHQRLNGESDNIIGLQFSWEFSNAL